MKRRKKMPILRRWRVVEDIYICGGCGGGRGGGGGGVVVV